MNPLLEAKDLFVEYLSGGGTEKALRGVSFHIETGEIVGLVGGSGSGKTTLALTLGRLTDYLPCRVRGKILFKGREVMTFGKDEILAYRKHHVAYVFQEPATSLNPVLRVGDQLEEVLERPTPAAVMEALSRVGMRDPQAIFRAFPHELSGGMKQRVMLAMALAKKCELLVADEPATALDVSAAKEILRLLKSLKSEGLSILYITHDLSVALSLADRILVMESGRIVETLKEKSPSAQHPYAKRLLAVSQAGIRPKTYLES